MTRHNKESVSLDPELTAGEICGGDIHHPPVCEDQELDLQTDPKFDGFVSPAWGSTECRDPEEAFEALMRGVPIRNLN